MAKMSVRSKFGKGLVLSIFQSLMLPKSLETFAKMVSVPTLPLGDYVWSSVGRVDGRLLAEIFLEQHEHSDKLCIDLVNQVYWSRLLRSRQELPILTEALLGHDKVWKLEEEFVMDVDQLSSRHFCATIEEDWVTGDAIWAIVDGECFLGARPYNLQSLLVNLLFIEPRVAGYQLNGLLPIIKYHQLLVALYYLDTMRSSTHRILVYRVQMIAKGIFKSMRDRYSVEPEDKELLDLTMVIVNRVLVQPAVKFKSKSWIDYLQRVWTRLQGLKGKKLIGVMKHRAMINLVCLAISMGLAEDFDVAGKVHTILESPRYFVPNRDLYALLIIMRASQEISLSLTSSLVFWTLASRNSDALSIMKVDSAHFGLLESLSENLSSREAFRYHLWSSPQAHRDLVLARSMDVKFALVDIFNNHFMAFSRERTGKVLLVPKLEIHPFVESRLSALLRIAVMLRIRLDTRLHPLYFKLLFGQGPSHEVHRPELLRRLVKDIIVRQFPNNKRNDVSINVSLRQLDTLHSECMVNKHIKGETSDHYADFLIESSRKTGFLENIWRIDGHQVAMHSILERMAVQVWITKYKSSVNKLDIGHIDLIADPQYLFFK